MIVNPAEDPGAQMLPSGERGGARWRADGSSRIEICKPDATGGESIERWSFYRPAVAADVFPAQVIGQQHDNIRPLGRLRRGGEQEPGEQEKCEGLRQDTVFAIYTPPPPVKLDIEFSFFPKNFPLQPSKRGQGFPPAKPA